MSRERRDIDMAISAGVNLIILKKSDTKAFQAGRSRSSTETSKFSGLPFGKVLLTYRS